MHYAHSSWSQQVNAGYLPRGGVFELKNPFPNCHEDKSTLSLPEEIDPAIKTVEYEFEFFLLCVFRDT